MIRRGEGMPLGCYSFCRGAKGPPSCCLPFPRCHPNGPSLCVCDSFSVCRSKIAELSQWHGESQACVCVCLCVRCPIEAEANSRKWIGMEDLAWDSGVKMKEFLHIHSKTPSLSFTLPSFCFWMHPLSPLLTHVPVQRKPA